MDPADPIQIAVAWWGEVIALAIDQDTGSRARLTEATGDPDAWSAFAAIDTEGSDPRKAFAELLAYVVEDQDYVDASRPAPGEPAYDPVLGRAAEVCSRLIRGLLAGNPACRPRPGEGQATAGKRAAMGSETGGSARDGRQRHGHRSAVPRLPRAHAGRDRLGA